MASIDLSPRAALWIVATGVIAVGLGNDVPLNGNNGAGF